jgi:pyruvate dehydrogenase E1 component alpha subunit
MDKGLWTADAEVALEEAIREETRDAVARFEARRQVDPLTMFDHVYAELPPHLAAQRAEVAERLRGIDGHDAPEDRPASPPMRGQRDTRWRS